MNSVTVQAPRNSKRSSSAISSTSPSPRLNELKQGFLFDAFEDLPRRWERIVQQGSWT